MSDGFISFGVERYDLAFGDFEGLFDGLDEPATAVLVVDQAVDDDLNAVAVAFVERRELVKSVDDTVDAGAGKAGPLKLFWDVLKGTLLINHNRRQDHQTRPAGRRDDLIDDRRGRLADDGLAVKRTVRHADTGE